MSTIDDSDVPELVDITAENLQTVSIMPPITTALDEPALQIDTKDEIDEFVRKVPVTILTGQLGSGKSTMLQHILKEKHGLRIAVIMNEFGDSADIEKTAVNIASGDEDERPYEQMLELPNGCLCCSVKDDGVRAIENLIQKSKKLDHILLETTGIADPTSIAELFWQDEGALSEVLLNGVVCLVDSYFIFDQLSPSYKEHEITEKQISCSDIILLNKIDLVQQRQQALEGTGDMSIVSRIEKTIQEINPSVPIYHTTRSRLIIGNETEKLDATSETEKKNDILLQQILNMDAYFTSRKSLQYSKDGDFLLSSTSSTVTDTKQHLHHRHDNSMSTQVFNLPIIDSIDGTFDECIRSLLWKESTTSIDKDDIVPDCTIYRCKGLIKTKDGKWHILQGVRELYEINEIKVHNNKDNRNEINPKIVFIGSNVGKEVEQYFIKRLKNA